MKQELIGSEEERKKKNKAVSSAQSPSLGSVAKADHHLGSFNHPHHKHHSPVSSLGYSPLISPLKSVGSFQPDFGLGINQSLDGQLNSGQLDLPSPWASQAAAAAAANYNQNLKQNMMLAANPNFNPYLMSNFGVLHGSPKHSASPLHAATATKLPQLHSSPPKPIHQSTPPLHHSPLHRSLSEKDLLHSPVDCSARLNDKNNNSIGGNGGSSSFEKSPFSSSLANPQLIDSPRPEFYPYGSPTATASAVSPTSLIPGGYLSAAADPFKKPLPKNYSIERLSESSSPVNKPINSSSRAESIGSTNSNSPNNSTMSLVPVGRESGLITRYIKHHAISNPTLVLDSDRPQDDGEDVEPAERSRMRATITLNKPDLLKGKYVLSKIDGSKLKMSRWNDESNELLTASSTYESLKRGSTSFAAENEQTTSSDDRPIDWSSETFNKRQLTNEEIAKDDVSELSEKSTHSGSTSSGISSPKPCSHVICDVCLRGTCCRDREMFEEVLDSSDDELADLNDSRERGSLLNGRDHNKQMAIIMKVNDCLNDGESASSKDELSATDDRSKSGDGDDESKSSLKASTSKQSSDDDGIVSTDTESTSSDHCDQLVLSRLSKARNESLDRAYENVCACQCECRDSSRMDCRFARGLTRMLDDFQSVSLTPLAGWSDRHMDELRNLYYATQMIITGDLNDGLKSTQNSEMIALELQSFAVTKFIHAFKYLPKFNSLCKEDQKRLLQPCCAELLLLRSTKHFDSLKEEWEVNSFSKKDEQIKLSFEIMKENTQIDGEGLYDTYLRFCENVKRKWREDDLFMTIIFVIVLFSSAKVIHDKKLSA